MKSDQNKYQSHMYDDSVNILYDDKDLGKDFYQGRMLNVMFEKHLPRA